jgi:hypothetical protein
MTVDNSTQIVTSTESGTGWTLDVTNANLSSDLSLKDFLVEFDGVTQSNSDFTKLSRTTVQYNGSSIGSTNITFYRDTPVIRIQKVTYGDRMTSSLWEDEFNRIHRILAEEGTTPGDQNFSDVSATSLNVSGQVEVASLNVEDLTNNRVVIAGSDGEIEDDSNLTYDGTDLSTNSLIVTDLSNNRVLLSGSGGAVEDSPDLTFNGTTFGVGSEFTVTAASGNTDIDGTLNVEGAGTFQTGLVSQEDIAQENNSTKVPTTAWIRDEVGLIANVCQGRITPLQNSPFPNERSATIGSGTLYYTRATGKYISLYNTTTSEWELLEIPDTDASLTLSSLPTTNQSYDLFAYNNAGTLALTTREWLAPDERDASFTNIDGVLTLDTDNSRRYLGCFFINSTKEAVLSVHSDETLDAVCDIWNHYNRIPLYLQNFYFSSSTAVTGITGKGDWEILTASSVKVRLMLEDADSDDAIHKEPYVGKGHYTVYPIDFKDSTFMVVFSSFIITDSDGSTNPLIIPKPHNAVSWKIGENDSQRVPLQVSGVLDHQGCKIIYPSIAINWNGSIGQVPSFNLLSSSASIETISEW